MRQARDDNDTKALTNMHNSSIPRVRRAARLCMLGVAAAVLAACGGGGDVPASGLGADGSTQVGGPSATDKPSPAAPSPSASDAASAKPNTGGGPWPVPPSAIADTALASPAPVQTQVPVQVPAQAQVPVQVPVPAPAQPPIVTPTPPSNNAAPSPAPAIVPLPTVPLEPSVDRSAILGLIASMPDASWRRLNVNAFNDVWAPISHQPLNQGNYGLDRAMVIKAWGGFAWDSKRSDLLLWGGGHMAYAGNELYRWRASTLRWERASLPSQVEKKIVNGQDIWVPIDGAMNAPSSGHAYDLNEYLPGVDRFVTFPAAIFNTYYGGLHINADGTHELTGPYLFDLSRADPNKVGGSAGSGVVAGTPAGAMWSNRHQVQQFQSRKFGLTDGTSAVVTESGRDVMYLTASLDGQALQHFWRYAPGDLSDRSTDRLERAGSADSCCSGRGSAAIDPVKRIYVRTGVGTAPFIYWNLDYTGQAAHNDAKTIRPQDLTGGAAPTAWGNSGIDFDRQRNVFMIWSGGADVWMLTPPAGPASPTGWTVSRAPLVGTSAPGPVDGEGGVLGKWKYAPELGVFVALRGIVAGEVWVYKPQGWRMPAS